MLPAIGSVSALAGRGQAGVVMSAQPIGEVENGRQLVALKIREGEQAKASSQNPVTIGPLTEKAAGLLNARSDSQTAIPGQPPLPEQSPLEAASESSAARLQADLSPAEKAEVSKLQQRDQQVKQEEKSHAAAAGDLAGPINYVYQSGPDGRQYAVGGSGGISASTLSGDPEEAKRLGARIAVAANAATNPSAQDYATARQAYALAADTSSLRPNDEAASKLDLTF